MNSQQIQDKIKDIQSKYQEQIEHSISSGKSEDIARIVQEMQNEMTSLNAMILELNESSPKEIILPKVLNNNLSDLDLDAIAYKSDLDFFRQLPQKTDYLNAIEQANKDNSQFNSRRSLLSTAMRMSENVSKPFFKIVDRCRETLKFKAPIEIFVVQDSHFNAAAMPMTDDRVLIYFTSSLLEKFSEEELAFVLGHEMGHIMFGHVNIPINSLAYYFHLLSGRDIIKLKSWQRAAELSADRAGLLCSQDYSAACTAFFKLSSGITSNNFKFNVNDYMVQFSDLEHYLKNNKSQNVNEVYSSHPLNPIRLKALEIFKNSEAYGQFINDQTNVTLKTDESELLIKSFMDIMEPNYLDDESKSAETIREFMFYSAYMIASADGKMDDKEIKQIASLMNKEDVTLEVVELSLKDPKQIIEDIKATSSKILFELSEIQRSNIVRDLFIVATADNALTMTEIDTMYNICNVFAVNPYLIEDLIRESNITVEQPSEPLAA